MRTAAAVAAAALLAAASSAFAHTTIKAQALEGTSDDNALKIGHGCSNATTQFPVIAQSVVFPTVSPALTASDGSTIADLSEVIVQGSVVGLADTIQDRSIFLSQQEKLDANGNLLGFSGTNGILALGLRGRVPFQFAAPSFVPTSCAKRLLIQVAIADICKPGGGPSNNPSIRPGKVNLWIPDNGSQYSQQGKVFNVDGVGSPATLTVNRNLTLNPLSPACGAGIDVTVTPSAADVDANLPIPGVWK